MNRSSRQASMILLLTAALLVPACGSTHPAPMFAYDHKASFANLQTYAWYADPKFTMPHGDSIIDGEFLDQHIRAAVNSKLRSKGYEEVAPSAASFLVAYHTGDTGVGEHDEYGNYEWATGYVVATNWEKERTVTIDIRDKSRKLIWRGSIDRLEGENPNSVSAELNREIATLLDKFPPSS